jgi:hypothetical protein
MTRASLATILARGMVKPGTRARKAKASPRPTKKTAPHGSQPSVTKNPKRTTKPRATARGVPKKEPPLQIPLSFAAVAAIFARDRRVSLERGWGDDNVVLKLDAKIFTMFVRGKLVTKLPKARVDELVSLGEGERFDPRRDGRLMKEWLVVASGEPRWEEVAREAYQFAKAGKPT